MSDKPYSSGEKCVWAGGHGGLRLAVFGNGVIEVRGGRWELIAAVSPGTYCQTPDKLVMAVDLFRGYSANAAEIRMLHEAFKASKNTVF